MYLLPETTLVIKYIRIYFKEDVMSKPISELTTRVERFAYAGYFLGQNIFIL